MLEDTPLQPASRSGALGTAIRGRLTMTHTLADRLRQFHDQSQGIFSCDLVRVDHVLAWSRADAPRARAFSVCLLQLMKKIESGSSQGCLCCNYSFLKSRARPSLFVFCFPTGNAAATGMLSGLCSGCSSRPAREIFEDVHRSLLVVWPALRIVVAPIWAGRA